MTDLLQAWADGDEGARDAAVALAYGELHQIAERRIRGEGDALTIDATGLAHEAFIRLADQRHVRWENRSHFFAIAARVMRRILVDRYRARKTQKRGGDVAWVVLSEGDVTSTLELDLESLNRALDRLALQDERHARLVELRFFGGLTIDDCAAVIGVSPATVKRDWMLARAWLKRELDGES